MYRAFIAMIALIGLSAACKETVHAHVDATVRAQVIEYGQRYSQWFYDGRYEDLAAKFKGSLVDSISTERLRSMRLELAENYGPETEIIEQSVGDLGDLRIYSRVVRFERLPAAVELQWTLDGAGDIHGFYLRPAAVTAETP